MTAAVWFVSVERPGSRAEWDCSSLGAPDPAELLPTRQPSSGDFSRHIPRRAYAATTGAAIELESGLEHDLFRWLDLRPDVVWLVGQPVRLHFPTPERRQLLFHTPDLLSQHVDGSVVLWDARPAQRHDDKFAQKVELTSDACRQVGWRHEVFEGLETPLMMNLLWLNGYRRQLPWHSRRAGEIEDVLRARPRTVGELRALDDGRGETVATMWHLIAGGKITCVLDRPIRDTTPIAWASGTAQQAASGGRNRAAQDAHTDQLVSLRLRGAGR